jgi:hypothetical protein
VLPKAMADCLANGDSPVRVIRERRENDSRRTDRCRRHQPELGVPMDLLIE